MDDWSVILAWHKSDVADNDDDACVPSLMTAAPHFPCTHSHKHLVSFSLLFKVLIWVSFVLTWCLEGRRIFAFQCKMEYSLASQQFTFNTYMTSFENGERWLKSTFGERVGQCLLNIEWRTGQGPKSWSRLFCISLPPTIGFSKYQPSACSLAKLAFHSRQSMEMKSGQCPKTHISQMITGYVSCHLCVSSVEITMWFTLWFTCICICICICFCICIGICICIRVSSQLCVWSVEF